MPWVSPTNYGLASANRVQIPYFTHGMTVDPPGTTFETAGGYCVGTVVGIGTSSYATYPVTLPVTLTKIRLWAGITGAVSSANLVVAVWHSNYDTQINGVALSYPIFNFSAHTPDAMASISLSSLPSVSASNNFLCTSGPTPVELTLNNPVTFAAGGPGGGYPGWMPFIAFYLDSGFAPASNVCLFPYRQIASFVDDSLDFTQHLSNGPPQQWDEPSVALSGCAPYGIPHYEILAPDLFFGAASHPRSYATIVG